MGCVHDMGGPDQMRDAMQDTRRAHHARRARAPARVREASARTPGESLHHILHCIILFHAVSYCMMLCCTV